MGAKRWSSYAKRKVSLRLQSKMIMKFFSGASGLSVALASASVFVGVPSPAQMTQPLRPGGVPQTLPGPQPVDRPPLCLAGTVAARVSQPLQAVNPTANTICQSFPDTSSPACGTLTAAAQLTLIAPDSFDGNGFRLSKSDSGAYVDVPIPAGKNALFAQEATDLPIRYILVYDLNGRTSQLSSGLANQGNIVATTSRGLVEQEIPIGVFPSGSINRRVRLVNPYRSFDLFLSRIYFKRWGCIGASPVNP